MGESIGEMIRGEEGRLAEFGQNLKGKVHGRHNVSV